MIITGIPPPSITKKRTTDLKKQEEVCENICDKQGFSLHSLQFKTWANFFLMAALILGCLWVIQILFFQAYYRSMREKAVENVGNDIASEFSKCENEEVFSKFIEKTGYKSGLYIIVFSMSTDLVGANPSTVPFKAKYISIPFNNDNLPEDILTTDPYIIEDWEQFSPKLSQKDRFIYQADGTRGEYLIYGATLGGDNYLYISSTLEPMDSTVMVLKNQLVIVTIICLLLSLLLSWFVSGRITKPITQFSLAAQRLAKGDYSVRFEGNGYTEIEDLADTLNYATEEMGKTESLRRDFLANVSHDLRTPLTMVKAYAEMIRDITGSDKVKRTQHSQVIIDEADRLTNLVNDILNLSKLQAGTEELTIETVDLSMLARTVVERFHIYSENSGYIFNVVADDDALVMGDSKRIEQVLYNLIGNAMNYTGDDKTVTIKTQNVDGAVRFSVTDSGKGIPKEEIDNVWERYYRASTRRREVVGNGLGLSIVKNILISHKANYGINSVLGDGSEFWFTLPNANYIAPLPQVTATKKHKKNS